MFDLVGNPEDRFSQNEAQMSQAGRSEKNIKVYHEFVDRIDNSVPRVTVWHHKAPSRDAKQ